MEYRHICIWGLYICPFMIMILSDRYNFHSLEDVDRVSETQLQVGGQGTLQHRVMIFWWI